MSPLFLFSFTLVVILGVFVPDSSAFSPLSTSDVLPRRYYTTTSTRRFPSPSFRLFAETSTTTTTATSLQDLSEPEQRVYSLVNALHESGYAFRIVVVGNGAILETTSILGPILKLNMSPKTGNPLLTMASNDQSFEFHLNLSETSKVALTEKAVNEKVIRVIRFLNNKGAPMCSLILGNDSQEAVEWYNELRNTYGEDVQL